MDDFITMPPEGNKTDYICHTIQSTPLLSIHRLVLCQGLYFIVSNSRVGKWSGIDDQRPGLVHSQVQMAEA